jgi:hypothetical protein
MAETSHSSGQEPAVPAAPANQETGIVVYKPESERFKINLRPSAIGISAGLVASNITHTIMDNTVLIASNTAAAGVHAVGYVAEKIAEYLGGPTVGMSVAYARHSAADAARHTVRAYSPLTTMIASAAVGTATALAVTAGEAVVCKAVPAVASVAGRAVSNVASTVYNSLPSRETLRSYVPSMPQMPRIVFKGVLMRGVPPPEPLARPLFGLTNRTDLISGPNYEPASAAAATQAQEAPCQPPAPPPTPALPAVADASAADAIPNITPL